MKKDPFSATSATSSETSANHSSSRTRLRPLTMHRWVLGSEASLWTMDSNWVLGAANWKRKKQKKRAHTPTTKNDRTKCTRELFSPHPCFRAWRGLLSPVPPPPAAFPLQRDPGHGDPRSRCTSAAAACGKSRRCRGRCHTGDGTAGNVFPGQTSRKQKENKPINSIMIGNLFTFLICIPSYFNNLTMDPKALYGIFYLGIFQLGLAYYIYSHAIKFVTAVDASLYAAIEPIASPILAYLFLGEIMSKSSLVGGSIILSSITIRAFLKEKIKKKVESQ